MSHTYMQPKTTFICNSDLSGDITVVNEHGEFLIDGNDVLNFVAEFVRGEVVAKIEDTDALEFLLGR